MGHAACVPRGIHEPPVIVGSPRHDHIGSQPVLFGRIGQALRARHCELVAAEYKRQAVWPDLIAKTATGALAKLYLVNARLEEGLVVQYLLLVDLVEQDALVLGPIDFSEAGDGRPQPLAVQNHGVLVAKQGICQTASCHCGSCRVVRASYTAAAVLCAEARTVAATHSPTDGS